MKKLLNLIFSLSISISFSQEYKLTNDAVSHKEVASGVYEFNNKKPDGLLISGETTFFDNMDFYSVEIAPNDTIDNNY